MKTKKALKIIIFSVAILLCLALTVGVTFAIIRFTGSAIGTINMDKGIIIQYAGFDKDDIDTDNLWQDNEVNFKLFNVENALQGTELPLGGLTIKPAEGSVDFYARFKLEYKFYADLEATEEVEGIYPADILVPSASFVNSAWVLGEDDFYYLASGTTLTEFKPTDSAVPFFSDGATLTVNPELKGWGFGYEIDGKLIKRVDVTLTLETAQVGIGWSVTRAPVIFNMDEINADVVYNIYDTNGEPVSKDNVVLDGQTGYQILDENGNGLQYYFTEVDLPDADVVSEIYYYSGSDLRDVQIPDYIIINGKTCKTTTIAAGAFEASNIEKLIIPDTVETIGDSAFFDNFSIHTVYLGKNVKTIGSGAFSNTQIVNLHMGEKVETIGDYAFIGGLFRNVELPNTVTSIGVGAFQGCNNLDKFVASGKYTTLDNGNLLMDGTTIVAFAPAGISEYNIPNGVEVISTSVFELTKITSINIPNTVTTIMQSAFSQCVNLTSVTIPNSVTDLENHVFSGCSNLTQVTIGKGVTTIKESTFNGCSKLNSVSILGEVTTIGNQAFRECKFTNIVLPASVQTIEQNAFQQCTELATVTIKATTPPNMGSGVFKNCSKLETIFVPAASKTLYELADVWGVYDISII